MSEPPPPPVPANPADAAAEVTGQAEPAGSQPPPSLHLDPQQLAAVLEDFEDWLSDLRAASVTPPAEPEEQVDLHTLLGGFLALRHEVNLQTKAVRAQQEQNSEMLRHLALAVEALEDQAEPVASSSPQPDEELRSLLKTLVDLYDALALASREVQRVQEAVVPLLQQVAEPAAPDEEEIHAPDAPPVQPALPRWARWLGLKSHDPGPVWTLNARLVAQRRREREEQDRQSQRLRSAGERIRQMLTSVVAGYTMSLQRVERSLQQQGLEPIPCVGAPFDPELMEVLEAVSESGRPGGEVLQEVRRGYHWKGRVFRYAQVRVARS
jgi:molecular chaperone GrpE